MNLIIVESPTKAKTLGRFLGSEYHVQFTMGHVMDLPKSKLGIDVDHDFKPEYIPVSKKKDIVQGIKQEARIADKIYLATDPDREGEAIAYHIAELLDKKGKSRLARIVFHEITDGAVRRALEKPGEINLQLVDAQQARRVLDRLVGYKLSPLLWRKIRRGLSAGRVQSVTVRLIVDKEREIEAFNSEEYWGVFVEVAPFDSFDFTQDKSAQGKQVEKVEKVARVEQNTFLIKLIKRDGEKIKIGNKGEAEKAVTDLEKASYRVSSIDKREVHKSPPAPFTTSTMAQAAARAYFWSAKKTMSVAQKLYEEGLITYHRTDSTNLSQEAINAARVLVKSKYGENYLPDKQRVYKVKSKVAQEAHEAIRPTDIKIQNPNVKVQIGRDGEILYGLIWKRFVACQMAQAMFDETTINVVAKVEKVEKVAKEYLLRASGQVMKFEGWRAIYPKKESEDGVVQLPEVREDEALQLIKVNPEQKFTEPPARYTEATLIKTLEKLGIGRPSTYAPTISTIQNRQYVEKTEGKFKPTTLGTTVNDFLVKYFPDIVDYEFTARMEDSLDGIAKGEKKWIPVIRNFWDPFSKKLEGVQEKAERVKIEPEKTGEKCPKCQEGEQVIRIGRFGRFLSCSRFPDCKWTAPLIEKLAMKCPQCGEGEVIVRKTKRGKRFYGCSRYPECKWASWRKPSNSEQGTVNREQSEE